MRYFASECDIWIANELKIPENGREVRLFFEGTAVGTSQSYTTVCGSQSGGRGGFSPLRPLLRLCFHGAQRPSSLYLCFHGARLRPPNPAPHLSLTWLAVPLVRSHSWSVGHIQTLKDKDNLGELSAQWGSSLPPMHAGALGAGACPSQQHRQRPSIVGLPSGAVLSAVGWAAALRI